MPPADPIEFLIIVNLRDALKTISVAGGYHFDVAGTAVKLDPNQDIETLIAPGGPRPFIVLEVLPEAWEYFPASEVRVVMHVIVHWVSDSTPTDDESRLKTFMRGCADVEQAIAIDPGRGGNAIDTRIVKRTPDFGQDSSSQVWAQIETRISLRRTYGKPNG